MISSTSIVHSPKKFILDDHISLLEMCWALGILHACRLIVKILFRKMCDVIPVSTPTAIQAFVPCYTADRGGPVTHFQFMHHFGGIHFRMMYKYKVEKVSRISVCKSCVI